MARRLRIAILGASPCGECTANCCKQNGYEFAVLLRDGELRRFSAYGTWVTFDRDGARRREFVLPYVGGRCQFLGADDRCMIYDDRPMSCRGFECAAAFNARGVGQHGRFLQLNPDILARLEKM